MKDSNGVYHNKISKSVLLKRLLWNITYAIFFRPFPMQVFHGWLNFVLRCFGAQIHPTANVYNSAKITYPWNLKVEKLGCLGPHAICDNSVLVTIGEGATVSQYAYLCASSHDIYHRTHDLISKPITLEKDSWVAAGAFVGMGVTIGEGAVVGARAAVFKDVEPWTVVGGNPAKFIKKRMFNVIGGGKWLIINQLCNLYKIAVA